MRHARLAPALLLIVAIALTIAYFASPASAETITVTRNDDPAPNGCTPDDCSFREAADLGNSTAGNQVIDIANRQIVLTSTVNLSGDLTVSGVNTNDSVIRIEGGAQIFSLAQSANVMFTKVWIYGASQPASDCGGAIYNQGTLHLEHVKLAKNSIAGSGAGLCNVGTADLDDVFMSANQANGGQGGAIYNSGTMTIMYSTITQNDVNGLTNAGYGAGIFNAAAGTLTVLNSTISSNTAISNTCDDCSAGAGVSNDGTVTIEFSTIASNVADTGAGLESSGTTTIRRSTFSGNKAGAILNSHGTMTISYSTISGNLASPLPDNGVGGISNYGTLSLTNATIADNTNLQFQYGGLYTANTGSSSYKATIFANNGARNCHTGGTQLSSGYNLMDDDYCHHDGVGDQVVADVMLGALQDNGGPTLTRLPLAGSPAINNGGPSCPGLEQRNAPHVSGCDVGAVEFGSAAPTPSPSPTPSAPPIAYPMGDPNCSDTVTIEDLLPELKLASGLQAPDTCSRTTIPCMNYNGMCYPVWVNTNCDDSIDARDVLPVAAKLAGAPMTLQCTPVGEYPAAG